MPNASVGAATGVKPGVRRRVRSASRRFCVVSLVTPLVWRLVVPLAHLGVEPERVRLLRSFDPRSGAHPGDVEDPYYGGAGDFQETFTVIEAALPGLHAWVDERLPRAGMTG